MNGSNFFNKSLVFLFNIMNQYKYHKIQNNITLRKTWYNIFPFNLLKFSVFCRTVHTTTCAATTQWRGFKKKFKIETTNNNLNFRAISWKTNIKNNVRKYDFDFQRTLEHRHIFDIFVINNISMRRSEWNT